MSAAYAAAELGRQPPVGRLAADGRLTPRESRGLATLASVIS
jgi:hypothetical protein